MIGGRGRSFALCLLMLLLDRLQRVCSQYRFVDAFENCHKADPEFDSCIKDGLNAVRPFFKNGLPEHNVIPFDPFFAPEVVQTTGIPMFNYKLRLTNVTEAGWTQSQVTSFKTDFNKNLVEYTQFFPDKRLSGFYEFSGNIFGSKIFNQGHWDLTLIDFIQSTTVTRKPRRSANGDFVYDTPLKVKIRVHTCRDMKLHASHLLGGRRLMEILLDRVINVAWPPGFMVLRPLVNDLVSTAFTDIFNNAFRYFPFDEIIH